MNMTDNNNKPFELVITGDMLFDILLKMAKRKDMVYLSEGIKIGLERDFWDVILEWKLINDRLERLEGGINNLMINWISIHDNRESLKTGHYE